LLEAGVVLLWLFLCSVVAGFIGIATTVQKYILFEGCLCTTFTPMKAKLITTKVTEKTVENLRIAAALSGKKQYEVAEEASFFVHGKYLSKKKNKTIKNVSN